MLIYLTVMRIISKSDISYGLYLFYFGLGIILAIVGIRLGYMSSIGTVMFFIGLAFSIITIILVIKDNNIFTYPAFWAHACIGLILFITSYLIPSPVKSKIKNGELALGLIKTITPIGEDDGLPLVLLTVTVSKKDGTIFEGEFKQAIWNLGLKNLKPGMAIWLLVAPDNQISLDQNGKHSAEEFYHLFEPVALATGLITKEQQEIRQQGIESKAKILHAEPKGSVVIEPVEVELTLLITLSDGREYEMQAIKEMPSAVLRLLRPESVVAVSYIAENPDQFIIHLPINPFLI